MIADFGLSCYSRVIMAKYEEVEEVGSSILLPKFRKTFISSLIKEVKEKLMQEKPVPHVTGDAIVVGDIHGHFLDLFRIFAKNGYPKERKYVFLGDYIDRGELSLDVVVFLFILKLNYPENIILLRGNHEFAEVNERYGFLNNITDFYEDQELWEEFNDCFAYLPIAAFIGDKIFCVHGGISEKVSKESLDQITFPIVSSKMIDDMVWSDPEEQIFSKVDNKRGKGVHFGKKIVTEFCQGTGVSLIIRGHECVNGFKYSIHKAILTVFSASDYAATNNMCGYAHVSEDGNVKCYKLPPIPCPLRANTNYYEAIAAPSKIQINKRYLSIMASTFIQDKRRRTLGTLVHQGSNLSMVNPMIRRNPTVPVRAHTTLSKKILA